jgi:hypothetical protein
MDTIIGAMLIVSMTSEESLPPKIVQQEYQYFQKILMLSNHQPGINLFID